MEPLKKNIRDEGKIPRRFTTENPAHVLNQLIRVWIVSKSQPDGGDLIGTTDSRTSEEGISGKGALCGTYITGRSKDVYFSISDDTFEEEFIQANSEVLSLNSGLFRKLFSEMKAGDGPPTIVIEASEESAFVRLLEFIYDSIPPPPSDEETADLLMISDEFQTLSCAQSCVSQLVHTLNSAFSCFELSGKVRWDKVRDSLGKAAMDYVRSIRPSIENGDGDMERIKHELLQVPFSGMEAVFSMDDLTVESEDVVYDFILFWAQTNYPNAADHGAAKELHLERLVRFPYLRHQKLEEALQCDFFYLESISKAVVEALAFRVREPYCRRVDSRLCSRSQFVERRYKITPIMVTKRSILKYDLCLAHFHLTEKELLEMFEHDDGRETEDFQVGHALFSLKVSCRKAESECYFHLRVVPKSEILLEEGNYEGRFWTLRRVDGRLEYIEIETGRHTYNLAEGADSCLVIPVQWPLGGHCSYILGGSLGLWVEIHTNDTMDPVPM